MAELGATLTKGGPVWADNDSYLGDADGCWPEHRQHLHELGQLGPISGDFSTQHVMHRSEK